MLSISELSRLMADGQHERALDLILDAEENGTLPPSILVLKGNLILLSESDRFASLDPETAYVEALAIDDEYVDALVELGMYYLNVRDNAEEAKRFLQKAIEVSRRQLVDSAIGLAEAVLESSGARAALLTLDSVVASLVDDDRIGELRARL